MRVTLGDGQCSASHSGRIGAAYLRRAYLPRGGDEATKLYDRTYDAISLDEIERILI
jgi:hypothetical protein